MHHTIELRNQPTGTERVEVIFNAATDAAILMRFTNEDGETYDVLLNQGQAYDLGYVLRWASAGA